MEYFFQMLAWLGIFGSSFIDQKARKLVPENLHSTQIINHKKNIQIGAPLIILGMLTFFVIGFQSSRNPGALNVNLPWAATIFWSCIILIITVGTILKLLRNRKLARNSEVPKRFITLDLISKAMLFTCGLYFCLSNLTESFQSLR